MIAKELQREAVRGRITHVDFYEVDLKTKIEVEVPIHLVGTPEGVTLGGVLDQQLREILLMCLPGSIPDDIQADVSGLALGDSLHVADLQVPAGVEIHSEPTLTVATVLVPRGLKDAGEEGAEGEAPATEAAPAS